MLKWKPWLPLPSKGFHVKMKLHGLHGLSHLINPGKSMASTKISEMNKIIVKMKWKGPRRALGLRLKPNPYRAKTSMKRPEDSSTVKWEEDFEHTCIITATKDNQFLPWDVNFTICQVLTGFLSRLT